MVGDFYHAFFIMGVQMSESSEKDPGTFAAISDEDAIFLLAALGVNYCVGNSYDSKSRELAEKFFRLDLKIVARMWDVLNDNVKIKILNLNSEKFKSWIISNS
jgi:hypothetical protein